MKKKNFQIHSGRIFSLDEDETLSMDNNKEFLPKLVGGQTLGYNREKNITDAEHYFTVETARGYIVINRE